MQVDLKKFCLRPFLSATFSKHMQAQPAPWQGPLGPLEGKEMRASTLEVSLPAALDKSSYELSAEISWLIHKGNDAFFWLF